MRAEPLRVDACFMVESGQWLALGEVGRAFFARPADIIQVVRTDGTMGVATVIKFERRKQTNSFRDEVGVYLDCKVQAGDRLQIC